MIMKLHEFNKEELCELFKRLLPLSYRMEFVINNYLHERWENKSQALIEELGKIDIIKDFSKFQRINKQLDKLHNDSDYYLQLDELKDVKKHVLF